MVPLDNRCKTKHLESKKNKKNTDVTRKKVEKFDNSRVFKCSNLNINPNLTNLIFLIYLLFLFFSLIKSLHFWCTLGKLQTPDIRPHFGLSRHFLVWKRHNVKTGENIATVLLFFTYLTRLNLILITEKGQISDCFYIFCLPNAIAPKHIKNASVARQTYTTVPVTKQISFRLHDSMTHWEDWKDTYFRQYCDPLNYPG